MSTTYIKRRKGWWLAMGVEQNHECGTDRSCILVQDGTEAAKAFRTAMLRLELRPAARSGNGRDDPEYRLARSRRRRSALDVLHLSSRAHLAWSPATALPRAQLAYIRDDESLNHV